MHSVHPTPKFSVITVTYNAEKVLEDTIQSVIAQTYHHVVYHRGRSLQRWHFIYHRQIPPTDTYCCQRTGQGTV